MSEQGRTAGAATGEPEVRRLLHELQVHQVELAQQNEELRAARHELEASLARSEALFELAPVALLGVDARGRIVRANRRAQVLLGAGASAGAPLADAFDAAQRVAVASAVSRASATPADPIELRLAGAGPDDDARLAELQACRPGADTPELLVALTETTERHRTERARQAQERAEAASRETSAFLARVSHELRTPLNAVLGFTHLLVRDPVVSQRPAAAAQVAQIREAGAHLLRLVDEVLDLSRLDAGTLAVQAETFDLGALLAEVVAALAPLAAGRQVPLRGGDTGAPTLVRADRERTRHVLTHLLTNAIQYNRPGGNVQLALSHGPDGVALAIADQGPGLTAEQLAGLFQPFNRAGAERGEVAGVGLGLTLARRFAVAMLGRLEVRSTPGQGSVFTLTLPGAAAGGAAAPLRVLYVEDNPINATVLAALLEERPQVTLEIAVDGHSGLERVHAQPPDLVLLDMQLPDMDGLEFFDRLRRDPALAGIPCVAVSANAMARDMAAAIDAGMAGYLTKPVDVPALFALIDRTRPRARAQP